jgi:hypothetical protein
MLPPLLENGQTQNRGVLAIDLGSIAAHSNVMSTNGLAPIVKNSNLMLYIAAVEQEIQRHKWFESERAGKDVGYEYARIDWTIRHRKSWMSKRSQVEAV